MHMHKKITAKEIWYKDSLRQKRIKDITNFKYLYVWELDWNKNKEETKVKIKKFLNEDC